MENSLRRMKRAPSPAAAGDLLAFSTPKLRDKTKVGVQQLSGMQFAPSFSALPQIKERGTYFQDEPTTAPQTAPMSGLLVTRREPA
jgi:hypothetical protein